MRTLASRPALALLNFYPLIYPMLHRLRAAAEYDCDERVLSRVSARYPRPGLEPAGLRCGAAGDDGRLLMDRFKRILESRRYEMNFWSRSAEVKVPVKFKLE